MLRERRGFIRRKSIALSISTPRAPSTRGPTVYEAIRAGCPKPTEVDAGGGIPTAAIARRAGKVQAIEVDPVWATHARAVCRDSQMVVSEAID
jgi:hypothetical protein